ncbi:MAG TPA: nuclear transport factor 2 family protein, partial [Actinomycetes bacterium]
LGFATDEVAGMLGTSRTAVKGALQRARAALGRARAGRAPRPASATEHQLARRFADAYVAADLPRLVALLTDDAWLSMPPAPHQYHGVDAIAAFWRASFVFRGDRLVRLLPTHANTQPALGGYLIDPAGRVATPSGLFVLTMAGDRIQAVTRFHLDALYPRFGLPASLPEPVGPLTG